MAGPPIHESCLIISVEILGHKLQGGPKIGKIHCFAGHFDRSGDVFQIRIEKIAAASSGVGAYALGGPRREELDGRK
jgi:hypothetical protein